MVFTIHRYIFREALRVFVLAALALTLIMSLGSVLRTVQEYGVGPRQVIHLIGYFLPITLTFVLPMAALFAASLIYGRLASDNELDACRASGISLLTLVYPGLALAIMVAIANLILSFHVMPAFIQRAKKSLKADAQQIIFRNIERRGYYKAPDGQYLLYADHIDPQNDTLLGVVITEMEGNRIGRIIAAESARTKFNPHKRFNEVQITAYKTYQIGTGDEGGFSLEWISLTKEFPSLMGDDIKFKKVDEIKKIRIDPARFYPIARLANQLYAQFTTELLAQDINTQSAGASNDKEFWFADDARGFYTLVGEPNSIKFTAGKCSIQGEKDIKLSDGVVAVEYDTASKKAFCTWRCETASLRLEGDELAPTLTVELHDPMWQRADGSQGLAAGWQRIRGLILPRTVTDRFETQDVLKAVNCAAISSALREEPTAQLISLQDRLRRKIQKTLVQIGAEIHSRLVFGIGCVPVIMIGIGLGIIKKGGHLLSAFGASSIPAAVLIVCIMMGKNVAKNLGAQAGSGILLMWAGLGLLILLTLVIYRKLLKN